MRRYTFEDDIHSAFGDIQRCTRLVKRCDSMLANEQLNCAVRKIKACARLVKKCDRLLCDSRARRGKGNRATAWEIRVALKMNNNKAPLSPNIYGKIGPNGDVTVYDRTKQGEQAVVGHATSAELDQAWQAAVMSERNQGRVGVGETGGGFFSRVFGGGGSRPVIGSFAPPSLYEEDKSKLVRLMSSLTKVVKLTAEIVLVLGAIKFSAAGDAIAEAGKQVGRFKNYIVGVLSKVKQAVAGKK